MNQVFVPSLAQAQKAIATCGSPLFLTNQATLIDRVTRLKKAFDANTRVYYAVKANFNPSVVRQLKEAGVDGIDTVSPFEIALAKKSGFSQDQIIYTGNGASNDELRQVAAQNVLCNLGSLSELDRFGTLFPGAPVSLRFNPGIGDGENKDVITAGQDSKFGIIARDIEHAKALIDRHQLQLKGIHCHIGSGLYDTDTFEKAVSQIFAYAQQFPGLSFVDLGGGFGVRYQTEAAPIDINAFGRVIAEKLSDAQQANGQPLEIRFEPGKYLVAESTCLLTTVTTVKSTLTKNFICLDTGFHHLIRPALYKAEHEIINLSHPNGEIKKVTVVGNVCESTDIFADDLSIAEPREADILAMISAGGYGASMSSLYNLRPYAAEATVLTDQTLLQTRTRLNFQQTLDGLGFV
jgi:diaminopimelate decarboxylase